MDRGLRQVNAEGANGQRGSTQHGDAARSGRDAGKARARQLAGDRVEVRSAGSVPADQVNPAAVEAMRELGIDISEQEPKVLTTEAVQASDYVITMGCGDACPIFPGKKYLDWALEDPAGKGVESVRPIRDEIKTRIEALITEIDAKHEDRD
ncbi:arsenate reductase ArsC [Streptomyces piniterrae]|uniref:arsenate reductase ArsC n=1 Tax=Streptomyces piniterrae TaxID=2571125 RepID=UPI001FE38989|nr:arsenate reductase ArsC [Streptomyces piniterrae]